MCATSHKKTSEDNAEPEKVHDETWFVGEYAKRCPQEELRGIMKIFREHKADKDRAKEVQKYLSPYGYHNYRNGDFDYTMYGFKSGVEFGIGSEEICMKYGRFVKELEKLCDPYSEEFLSEDNNNIDSANNNVVTDQPESATESVENETEKDIIDTECRGIATKSGGKEPASILTYLVEACIDHFKFADLYEESEDTDEFYDKLYDSMFGQSIQFYYDGDEFRAEFSGNIHITSTGLKKVRRESYRWWQFLEELERIGNIGEKYAAENAEICDQEDNGSEEVQFNETAVKNYLQEERQTLDEYEEAISKTENFSGLVMIRQRMIVEALELLLEKMTNPEEEIIAEREQPELPVLRNNEQRKAFLAEYKTWPVWFEVPQAAETYYRYDLPDESSIVVCEYHEWLAWAEKYPSAYPEGPDRIYKSYYLLKPGYHYLHDCSASETELINQLKDVQKKTR